MKDIEGRIVGEDREVAMEAPALGALRTVKGEEKARILERLAIK